MFDWQAELLAIISNGLSSPVVAPTKIEEFGLSLELLGRSFKEKATALRVDHFRRLNSERPAVTLPPELLSEIFLFACAHKEDAHDHHQFLHGEISRWTRHNITSTCLAWRETALAVTSLWNCISIVIGSRDDYKNDEPDEDSEIEPEDHRLAAHNPYPLQWNLKRAGDRPFKLLIRVVGTLPHHWGPELAALRAALPRSRFLCIVDRKDAGLVSALVTGQPIPFPHLKTFIVDSPTTTKIMIDLSLAPQLEIARVHGTPGLAYLVTRNILRLSDIHTSIHRLQRCKRLQWLSLRINSSWTQRLLDRTFPEVKLSHLLMLSISWPKTTETFQTLGDHALLSAVAAPKLRYLQLHAARIPSAQGQHPSLYSLDLRSRRGDPPHTIADLRILFAHFEDIGELLMPDHQLGHLEDILIAKDEHGGFKWLPKLRDLWLETADDETAKKLLAVRNGGLKEERRMPFRLNLKMCTPELKKSHTCSVKVRSYIDPFEIVNGSIPISDFGVARSRRPLPPIETEP